MNKNFSITYSSLQWKLMSGEIRAIETIVGVGYILKSLDRLLTSQSDAIRVGALQLNVDWHECWFGAKLIHLPNKQFRCLTALARQAGNTVSRETLAAAVWIEEADQAWARNRKEGIDNLVATLRSRIKGIRITAVPGEGYQLELE